MIQCMNTIFFYIEFKKRKESYHILTYLITSFYHYYHYYAMQVSNRAYTCIALYFAIITYFQHNGKTKQKSFLAHFQIEYHSFRLHVDGLKVLVSFYSDFCVCSFFSSLSSVLHEKIILNHIRSKVKVQPINLKIQREKRIKAKIWCQWKRSVRYF